MLIKLKLIVLAVKLLPYCQVGVERFELPTSSSQMKRASQTALHPEIGGGWGLRSLAIGFKDLRATITPIR